MKRRKDHSKCSEQANMDCFDSSKEDRISELPDEIITHILSFLQLKEAVVTSVLSKRWKKQWVYYAKYLHFDYKSNLPMDQKLIFTEKVNRLLKFHKSPTIEEFRICVLLDASFKTDIDNWLKFALERRVQRLELHLDASKKRWFHVPKFEQYPLEFLPSPNVVNSDQFKSLKSLSLKDVDMSGDVVEKILATCPVLEQLNINQSLVLKSLKVVGSSVVLKYLEIAYCDKMKFLEMRNLMNLVSFTYMGSQLCSFSLKNVPQLVELSLGGGGCSFYLDEFLPKFSCFFSQLETLELKSVLTADYDQVNPPKLPNLRRFTLTCVLLSPLDPCHLKYIPFIMAAPLLEKFILRQYWYRRFKENDRRLIQRANGRHEQLQELEFDGFYGSNSEQELVLYFTKSITSLQRIIIRLYPCESWRQSIPEGHANSSYIKSMKEKRAESLLRAKNCIGASIPPHVELIII